MKKSAVIILFFTFLLTVKIYSLEPFYYSTVAIDDNGQILDNTTLDVKITIVDNSSTLYTETFSGVETSQFAVFTVFIGSSNPPAFSGIEAEADTRLQIEVDDGGGWSFCERKLLGEISGNVINTISDYAWMLKGNNGTNPTDNFIGTKDAQGFAFRTNNSERMRIADNGFVGINNPSPISLLDVLHPSTTAEPYVQRIYSGWKNVWGVNEYLFTQVGFLRIDQDAPNVVRYYSGYFVAEVSTGNPDNINPRIVPLQGQMDHFGSGTLNEVRGVAGFVNNRTTGTITTSYSGYFEVNNYGSGTITNGHTIYIHNGAQNGTMNNKSGVTITEISGATNNTDLLIGTNLIPTGDFSIYNTSNRDSYFSGNLGMVPTAPPVNYT